MADISKVLLGSSIIKSKEITKEAKLFIRINETNNDCNIVFIFMGKVPPYIRESYYQLRYWTDAPIYLLTDDELSIEYLSDIDIKVILYKNFKNKSCEVMYEHKKSFGVVNGLMNRELLFFYSMVRFIILEAFMEKYNIKNAFHLEIDNLVYFDPKKYVNILFSKPIGFMIDNLKRGSGGLFCARSANDLNKMNTIIIDYVVNKKGILQEMLFLGEYQYTHNNDIFVLPCLFDNANELCMQYIIKCFSENFSLFNNELLFDPASLGQVMTGEDPFHTKGILRKGFGHNNLGTSIDYSKCIVEWEYIKNNNIIIKYPIIKYNNRIARIANLHVHSKDMLCNMSGTLPKPNNRTFITGEKIQQLCDQIINDCDIDNINGEFDNKRLIYVNGHSLKLLCNKFKYFKNKFVLISHNSDANIDDSYLEYFNDEKLIALYAQNTICTHPKVNFIPIGIANSKWDHGNLSILEKIVNETIHFKPNSFYFYFSLQTNIIARQKCYIELCKKGLKWDISRNYEEYLREMKRYEYIICPEGNGIDTHRYWEAIYLGRIPVVINSPFIQKLKPYFKMVILEQWSDLNINNNGSISISMPNKYSKLWIEDYKKEIENLLI